jgi:DNA-binding NtrC family response regulator
LAESALRQSPETILVVDDDQDMCWVLEVALAGLGHVVKTVGTAQSAISSVTDHAFPVAFVDARLPDMDGLRLVEQLRGLRPAMRIIMISGYYLEDDTRILEAMRESRIDRFLAKPFQIETIVTAATGGDNGNSRP